MLENLSSFTRGGQVIMHHITMWYQVIKKLILWGLFFTAISFVILSINSMDNFERHVAGKYLITSVMPKTKNVNITWYTGETYTTTVEKFRDSKDTKMALELIHHKLWHNVFIVFGLMFSVFSLVIAALIFKGRQQSKTRIKSGGTLVSSNEFTALVKGEKMASNITIGGAPLIKNSEVRNTLILGSPGSGKTLAIYEMLLQIRALGYKTIIYDIEGSFIERFYREGIDKIINPLDARSVKFSLWNDARNKIEMEHVAASLVPEPQNATDPFWYTAARQLFVETACNILQEREAYKGDPKTKPSIKKLLNLLTTSELDELNERLKGSMAESMTTEKSDRMAFNVKATLSAYLRPLELLCDEDSDFSLREWIHEKNDSWLFISSNQAVHATMKPLLSTIFDIVANELLSLGEDFERRIVFVTDEEATLNPSRSMDDLRSTGRKRGVCLITAYQTLAQVRKSMGTAAVETLSSMFSTRVFFLCNDLSAAEWVSKDLGQQEVEEPVENISMGAHPMRDAVNINIHKRKINIVEAETIRSLESGQGFMRVGGRWPVTKIQLSEKLKNLPKQAGAFIPNHLENKLAELTKLEEFPIPPLDDKAEREQKAKDRTLDVVKER